MNRQPFQDLEQKEARESQEDEQQRVLDGTIGLQILIYGVYKRHAQQPPVELCARGGAVLIATAQRLLEVCGEE